MKKNIYLAVIWTITLACIIFSTQSRFNSFRFNIINFFTGDKENAQSGNFDISKNLDAFTELTINGNAMDIEITKGDKFHIDSNYSNTRLEPEISISDDKLSISQKGPFIGFRNNICKIKLYIPENSSLGTVKIENDVGDIKINKLSCAKLNVESDVGNISVKNINCNKINLNTDVGNIKLETKDNLDNYNIYAKSDVGDIFIEGKKHKKHFESESETLNQIKITSDVGKITIN